MVSLDQTILANALPTIGRELGNEYGDAEPDRSRDQNGEKRRVRAAYVRDTSRGGRDQLLRTRRAAPAKGGGCGHRPREQRRCRPGVVRGGRGLSVGTVGGQRERNHRPSEHCRVDRRGLAEAEGSRADSCPGGSPAGVLRAEAGLVEMAEASGRSDQRRSAWRNRSRNAGAADTRALPAPLELTPIQTPV